MLRRTASAPLSGEKGVTKYIARRRPDWFAGREKSENAWVFVALNKALTRRKLRKGFQKITAKRKKKPTTPRGFLR